MSCHVMSCRRFVAVNPQPQSTAVQYYCVAVALPVAALTVTSYTLAVIQLQSVGALTEAMPYEGQRSRPTLSIDCMGIAIRRLCSLTATCGHSQRSLMAAIVNRGLLRWHYSLTH